MQNDVVRWLPDNFYKYDKKHKSMNNNNIHIEENNCFQKVEKTHHVNNETSHKTDLLSIIAFNESKNQFEKCDSKVYDFYFVQKIVNSSRYIRKNNIHKRYHQEFDDNNCRRYRNNITIKYGTSILFLLHLSALIILCSLNIGFVTSTYVEKNLSKINNYDLDYEEDFNNYAGHYTHTWAVNIPDGDRDRKADTVAHDHGFVNLGKVGKHMSLRNLKNYKNKF